MSALKSAIDRLSRAVDGLERAAASRRRHGLDQAALAAELAEAKAECARLASLTGIATERLDGAIATIKTALEV